MQTVQKTLPKLVKNTMLSLYTFLQIMFSTEKTNYLTPKMISPIQSEFTEHLNSQAKNLR
jgi:hypothetical protein